MRQITVDMSLDKLAYPTAFGGYVGEHNATRITAILPARVLTSGADEYRFSFKTAKSELIFSEPVEISGGSASVLLWSQLTAGKTLQANVCGFNVEYDLTTEEPVDWERNYGAYYTRSGEAPDYVYTPVVAAEAPTWEENTYYKRNVNMVAKTGYLPLYLDATVSGNNVESEEGFDDVKTEVERLVSIAVTAAEEAEASAAEAAAALPLDTTLTQDGKAADAKAVGDAIAGITVDAYTKAETDALLDEKADVSDVYTKTATDDLLDEKADKSDTYTKSEVEAALEGKADANDTYTKSEVDAALSSKADASNVYTKGEVEADLALKADSADVYSKTAADTLLEGKVDKENGKGLSSNDFTDADKTKLDGIESGAQVNTVTGVKGDAESSYRTGNINITKGNIGLGNVDNTSDANKPVSTAQQTALNNKQDKFGDVSISQQGKVSVEVDVSAGFDIRFQSTVGSTVLEDGRIDFDDEVLLLYADGGIAVGGGDVAYIGNSGLTMVPGDVGVHIQSDDDIHLKPAAGKAAKYNGKEIATTDQLPTVNDGTLTIKANGTTKGTFSANDSGTVEVNITKSDIGLGNVDNTSDTNKPISNATQTALDNKVDKVSGKGLSTNDFTSGDKAKLDAVPTNPSANGLYCMQVSNGVASYVALPVYNGGVSDA